MPAKAWLPLLQAVALAAVAQAQQPRPMVVDDLETLEQLGDVVPSPDGEWLAVVVTRARNSAKVYRDFPWDLDHADIWLISRRSGNRRNITNGITDDSGYWNPVWSPDGKRLALLSTRGGDNVRPYVWEMRSGTLRQMTGRGADLLAFADEGFPHYAMIWSDSTTLLCATLPEGAPPTFNQMSRIRSYSHAVESWAAASKGGGPTVSVLESGREIPQAERPNGQLLAINVVSGKAQILAEANVRQLLLSPTQEYLGVIAETGRVPPQPTRKIPYESQVFDLWRSRLAILPLKPNPARAVWVDSVYDPKLVPGTEVPHKWSPDESSLAVVGKPTPDEETAEAVFLVSAATATARQVTGRQLAAAATAWSSGGALLVLARSRTSGTDDTTRLDWWTIDHRTNGTTRRLTASLKNVPAMLWRTPDHDRMLGAAAGNLWSIDVRAAASKDMTETFDPVVQAIVWPSRNQPAGEREIIISAEENELYWATVEGPVARMRRVARPSKASTIVVFRPEDHLAVFSSTEPSGTFLWTSDRRSSGFKRRLALNQQVSAIANARRMLIDYQGIEGDSLKAVLLLPVGYERGKRYPLIAYVYAGLVLSDTLAPWFDKQSPGSLNLNLLPARGYAVLIPSMPLRDAPSGGDLYLDLPKGVMGALDKVIALGIADPEKLGVMGHSFGGYSTYSLLTYTHRFKAGVALAGAADLVSLYGSFMPPSRYDDYAHEDLFLAAFSESGLFQMGNAPSRDLWRYLRNSPYYFVDRVQTPLMIIQGDMDYVPLQQGEEFFIALYRLGKKAKFVRYWGEGHVIESPANTRDMWHRMFEWFDEYLKGLPPGRPGVAAEKAQ